MNFHPCCSAVWLALLFTVAASAQSNRRAVLDDITIIVPQTRSIIIPPPAPRPRPMQPVTVTDVRADISIRDQVATTTLLIGLHNPARVQQQAELIVPVPDQAVVRMLDFQGGGSEPSFQILPREEARRIYDEIVNLSRDPALLEFAGLNLLRSSVFPVEAGGTQKIKLVYEALLKTEGNCIDYVLPRSEAIDYRTPWRVTVDIRSTRPIHTVYSPSHPLVFERVNDRHFTAHLPDHALTTPGALRLSCLLGEKGVAASLVAYPDPKTGGGYFLLLAAAPPPNGETPAIPRELTLVIDRSGSMNGPKIQQVREAAMQVIAGLDEGETFNIIAYNETVEFLSPTPLVKNPQTEQAARDFLTSMTARGGTNIHDALLEALRPQPAKGALPVVLFLTDGLPTIGVTSEKAIRELAEKGNRFKRRVFTFGVGVDVNTPLLEAIADQTRAVSTFVLPEEDVEVKVSAVFKRLTGPVMADPQVAALEMGGEVNRPALGRVSDLMPSRLPDLFEDDQLVLVGRYVGEKPLMFQLSGNYQGHPASFEYCFDPAEASAAHAFVARLWASRKIARLIDAIRAMGADGGAGLPPSADPRFKELVDEVVRLSTEFGILTEYTAFLAREGTDLTGPMAMGRANREAEIHFQQRALARRSGLGSVNQETNIAAMKAMTVATPGSRYLDEDMRQVEVANVQQFAGGALYRQENRWIDSKLVHRNVAVQPDRVIAFGSAEHFALAERLVRENRQALIAVKGDVLLGIDGQVVLIQATRE